MRDFLCSVFPGFTKEMYDGNTPCGFGHRMTDGGMSERWSTKYGGGETYKGRILTASFSLNHKISIFICGDGLHILDIRYSGRADFWEYSNKAALKCPCYNERSRHILEEEKIEAILNTKIKNCKLWDIVQRRAKELYLTSQNTGGQMIYTSYFSKYKGKNGLSIARSQPTKNGKPYYEELNEFRPPKWLLEGYKEGSITEKEFKHYYKNIVLRGFNPTTWGKRLQGKVLLCWEKPDDFCHRQTVADWLRKAGYEVKEWEKTDDV